MEKLTYEKFKEALKVYFSKQPELADAEISISTNELVNQKIDCLVIKGKDASVYPSLRLNDAYKGYLEWDYDEELLFENIFKYINETFSERRRQISFASVDALLRDRAACKEKLIMELINEKGNESLLQDAIHRDLCNLKIIYRLIIDENANGMMSIVITKTLIEHMNMLESELYEAALKNTRAFMKPFISENPYIRYSETMQNTFMVMGDCPGKNCSALIADPDYLREVAEMLGTDFYIVPTSIEGFNVVRAAYCDVDMQKDVLMLTNEYGKKDKLFLSNDLYFYDSSTGALRIA